MIKYFLSIFISLLFFNQTLAKDISIKENIDLEFICDLEKKIIKINLFIINNLKSDFNDTLLIGIFYF